MDRSDLSEITSGTALHVARKTIVIEQPPIPTNPMCTPGNKKCENGYYKICDVTGMAWEDTDEPCEAASDDIVEILQQYLPYIAIGGVILVGAFTMLGKEDGKKTMGSAEKIKKILEAERGEFEKEFRKKEGEYKKREEEYQKKILEMEKERERENLRRELEEIRREREYPRAAGSSPSSPISQAFTFLSPEMGRPKPREIRGSREEEEW